MIQPLFTKAFNQAEFGPFIQGLVPGLELSEKRAEKKTGFTSIQQIAEGVGADLDMVVFIARPEKSLNARAEITKNTYSVLKNHARSNALVAYLSEDSSEWRLSLITTKVTRTKEGIRESISNPRRFSYLLGPDAKTLTPSKMLSGSADSIKVLEDKFSLAIVSKEFYTKIAIQYSKLVGGTRGEGKKAITYERTLELSNADDTINANFAIRLIGRLVFSWFLKQKHGSDQQPLIPHALLSARAVTDIGDYYHTVCAPLFFEVLNKPQPSRPNFFAHDELLKSVPFLNGGLFQDHKEDNHKFNRTDGISDRRGVVGVPDEWFAELFEIFEEYNFTIDENTAIDTELSIDPEMLGRIFENLLAEVNPETGASARKATGSFYTPREIVDFMVEESLVAHLQTKTELPEDKIRALSSYDLEDDAKHPFTKDEKKLLVETINQTTILDPACGSGAFPIGVLQRMVHMLGVLDPDCAIYLSKMPVEARRHLQQHNPAYIRKLGVIRECIHGVDIQPVAVDISRLRCFLTLVVDQQVDDNAPNKGIEPLPNLDFKFVCANTLISPPAHDGPLFGDEFAEKLGELIDEYFAPVDQLHKLETAQKLQQLINEKTKAELESIVDSFGGIEDPKYRKMLAKKREAENNERIRINNLWSSYENIFQNKLVGFFGTRYFFPAVYRKSGFNIVIGNPPYVGEKGHMDMFREILNSPLGERFYQGQMDLFYYFFHVGFDNLQDKGVLAYITTNYYPTARGARKLREDFKNRSIIAKLVNFNELKIFKSAAGQHNMVSILLKNKDDTFLAETTITKNKGDASASILESIVSGKDNNTQYLKIKQKDLYDGKENYIRLAGSSSDSTDPAQSAINKIKQQGVLLSKLCNVNVGLYTGADKVSNNHIQKYSLQMDKNEGIFILNKEEVSKLNLNGFESSKICPFYKNSDISLWHTKEIPDLFLINVSYPENKDIDFNNIPNIFKHLSRYEKILRGRKSNDNGLRAVIAAGYWWSFTIRQIDFSKPKIVVPQRSPRNTFGYNEIPWYASADVYFITERDKSISLKYALSLLNSKLYYLWLYHRGKRKGEMLELYQQPLSEIPIKKISTLEQKPFVEIVDNILEVTQSSDYLENQTKKEAVTDYENQIDDLVYKLYDLTPEEIEIVENSSKKDS